MKKIVYLLLILILSFSLFSACGDNQAVEKISSSSENTISNHIEQKTDTSSNSSQTSPSDSTIPSAVDENFVAFINFSKCRIDPNMNYTQSNDDTYYYRQTHGKYNETDGDKYATNLIYAKDYFHPNSTNYDTLTDDDIIMKYSGEEIYTPNNNVIYIDYTDDDTRAPNNEWINYFKMSIQEEMGETDTPIIIKESWSFDINGTQHTIVNASNDSSFEEVAHNNTPDGKNLILYHISAWFIENEATQIIGTPQFIEISNKALDFENGITFSFIPPVDDVNIEYQGQYMSTIYQYNENNTISLYNCFTNNPFGYYFINSAPILMVHQNQNSSENTMTIYIDSKKGLFQHIFKYNLDDKSYFKYQYE